MGLRRVSTNAFSSVRKSYFLKSLAMIFGKKNCWVSVERSLPSFSNLLQIPFYKYLASVTIWRGQNGFFEKEAVAAAILFQIAIYV